MRSCRHWVRLVGCFAFAAVGCSRAPESSESTASASAALTVNESVLGFELASQWTPANATVALSQRHVDGQSSLAVRGGGYMTVTSRTVSTLSNVGAVIGFDLELPSNQPNPQWFGAAQLYVNLPSKGLNEFYVGQVELTGKPLGIFHRVEFPLSSSLQTKLKSSYTDLSFKIALNVPSGQREYLVDRLAAGHFVNPPLPPPPGQMDTLSFEGAAWTVTNGTAHTSTEHALGNGSLELRANGYTTLKSPKFSSLGQVKNALFVFVKLPTRQVNPSWYGDLQLYYDLPSRNKTNVFVGQKPLTGLALGRFVAIRFDVPEADAQLWRGEYDDLRLTFALNVPAGGDAYLFDAVVIDTPENAAAQQCFDACNEIQASNCSATPARVNCFLGCRFGILHPRCKGEWMDYTACQVSAFDRIECDELSGEPVFVPCEQNLDAYQSCLGQNPL